MIFEVDYVDEPAGGHLSCGEHNDRIREYLYGIEPGIVVYIARMQLWLEESRFDNGEGGVELGTVDILEPRDFSGDRRSGLAAAVTETITEILEMGHQVVLVYPVPEVGWDVPRAILSMMPDDAVEAAECLQEPRLTTSYARYRDRTASSFAAYDAVPDQPGLVRVYPSDVFCDGERCFTCDESSFFYSDDDHLSAAGAAKLADEIVDQVRSQQF